jgi:hypothetical protein
VRLGVTRLATVTEPQERLMLFMHEAGRELIRFDWESGDPEFFCGRAAGNMVNKFVALGVITKGFVDELPFNQADPDWLRGTERRYRLNDKGRKAINVAD